MDQITRIRSKIFDGEMMKNQQLGQHLAKS